jgi:modification methylase
VKLAQARIDAVEDEDFDPSVYDVSDKKRNQRRIPFGRVLDSGLLKPGQKLFFMGDRNKKATILVDGTLTFDKERGSIHQTAKIIAGNKPANGWQHWFYEDEDGDLKPIDDLRTIIVENLRDNDEEIDS